MHHEYESLEEQNSFAQGDVIRWEGAQYAAPWRTYGVIVTADCDLEFGKHRGRISYVPALLTLDYLWYHWRPGVFYEHERKAVSTMAIRVNNWREKHSQRKTPLSEDAIIAWLGRADRDAILNELGVEDKSQRNTLAPIIDKASSLLKLLRDDNPDLSLLKYNYSIVHAGYDTKPQIIVDDFQKALSSLPGDIFHIPILPDNTDSGLFLLLREISQCSISDIARTPDDLRYGSAKARRVARISAPYRYAITQQLARVFSDIGLPKAYELRCNAAASKFFSATGSK